jgi:hypothetical protein
MMDEMYLCEYEGGLFNGGAAQMERPNTFIIQQGRAAESVLMEIVKKILADRHPGKVFTIPSNGHFDTTEGNIKQMGSIPRNLYNKQLLWESPEGGKYARRTRSRATWISRSSGELIDGRRPRKRAPDLHLHHQQPRLRPARLHGQPARRQRDCAQVQHPLHATMPPAGRKTATSSR